MPQMAPAALMLTQRLLRSPCGWRYSLLGGRPTKQRPVGLSHRWYQCTVPQQGMAADRLRMRLLQ